MGRPNFAEGIVEMEVAQVSDKEARGLSRAPLLVWATKMANAGVQAATTGSAGAAILTWLRERWRPGTAGALVVLYWK